METDNKARVVLALGELLQEHTIRSIKVKDIIRRAGVSKATFYRLFQDKYQVMCLIYQREADSILLGSPQLCNSRQWLCDIFNHILENKKLYKNMVSYDGQNSFFEFLLGYAANETLKRAQKELNVQALPEELSFSIVLWNAGADYMIVNWIKRGFDTPPEALADLLENSKPHCLRRLCQPPQA